MGRYRLIMLGFGAVMLICSLVGVLFADDPVGVLTILVALGAATATTVLMLVASQQKIERLIRGGTNSRLNGGAARDREYQRELRIAEVVTRDMPEAHAEQLARAFHARADRIEALLQRLFDAESSGSISSE